MVYRICYFSGDSMTSPVRRDSTSEYSNMSEPGKLEIDTGAGGPASKMDSAKQDGDNEVSNVCIVEQDMPLAFCLFDFFYMLSFGFF